MTQVPAAGKASVAMARTQHPARLPLERTLSHDRALCAGSRSRGRPVCLQIGMSLPLRTLSTKAHQ